MNTIKIFVASSSELKDDRNLFRDFISKENDRLHKQGIYLELVQWENFLDTISDTRLQDEYNNAIRECDIVVCLFFTKVGKYSAEEFDTAYQIFKDKGKPKIWTYFKNAQINTGAITDEINTLLAFKKKLGELNHFYTEYTNIDNLINKYRSQLDLFLPKFVSQPILKTPIEETPVKNTFNEIFPGRLIEAIRPYNKKANEFLNANSNWQNNADLVTQVKRIVISGFVGAIGIQLRKLGAIGEEKYSESKMKRYLENCLLTAKRGMQLICFSLISTLWDKQKQNHYKLSQAQIGTLNKLFKTAVEESITDYAELLRTLTEIFSTNNLVFPIPQLSELQTKLNTDSSLINACVNLNAITDLIKQGTYTVDDCTAAESNLVIVLENLSFLAEYKIISIKDIDYAIQRNDKEGLYLHNYTLLDGESQANNNSQARVKRESTPVISYSVLLCKENLRQNINLDPFVIDFNSLGLTGGSKICFFSFCDTYGDQSLNYSFIEDTSKITIRKSKNQKPDEKDTIALNKWLANNDNKKDMNFDNVINLFDDAKRTLTGAEETITDDEL
ncbi:MAG: hypothetical protein IPO27_06900 [Bacteroidetes bacterium]|nr:hypothetical protein [Bacteroidota bacterium]